MNEAIFELPAIPAGMMLLLSFFSPFLIALVNHPTWTPRVKYVVAIIVTILLTIVVIIVYYAMSGDIVPSWPVLLIIGLAVAQAAYALVWKKPASQIEQHYGLR